MAAACAAVLFFKLAYVWPVVSLPATIAFTSSIAWLTSRATVRYSFYAGLAIGTTLAAIELTFFHNIFGPAAIGLWLILGLWMSLFTATAAKVQQRWPGNGFLFFPVLWIGFEYFRGELYYLRFTWVTPGLALVDGPWQSFLLLGQYGLSGLIALSGMLCVRKTAAGVLFTVVLLAVAALPRSQPSESKASDAPVVAGIQLEFEPEAEIPRYLDKVLAQVPDADILMLSEYTFNGLVPVETLNWCDENDRYLIVGGKDALVGGQFRNTVFVCGPDGSVVHKQAKMVPIQFFSDGLPAEEQKLWESPWGRVGFAICYDMSYTRVIDELVKHGAQVVLNPTMDPVVWGAYEHELHSRIPAARAAEYGVPVYRLASSGVSVFVDEYGEVQAKGQFPGKAQIVSSQLHWPESGRLPPDRWLTMICVVVTILTIAVVNDWLAIFRVGRSDKRVGPKA